MYMKDKRKRGYSKPPKPVVLVPPFFGKPLEVEKDARLDVDALIFGDYTKYLPELIVGMGILGKLGLGNKRHYRYNRFEIEEIRCKLSNRAVYDGSSMWLGNVLSIDVMEIPKHEQDQLKVGFRTPFTGKPFPPSPERFLWLIRHRLVSFVNEYGNGELVPDFKCRGYVVNYTFHRHKLERRSIRSQKTLFHGFTGIVDYKFLELDDVSRWLINVGLALGCGPDSSFGCGFLQKY